MTKNDNSALKEYLIQINKIPLLTAEQEIELSKTRMKYPKNSKKHKKAVENLVKANLRFGVRVAKRYQNQDYELTDLIGYATEGLYEAAERYDYTTGYKFVSYAVWWIRQKIMRNMQEDKLIRFPPNVNLLQLNINKIIENHFPDNIKPPPYEKISKYIKVKKEVYEFMINSSNLISLQTPIMDDTYPSTIEDFLPAENYIGPEKEAELKELETRITSELDSFNRREKEIMKYRYGLEGRLKRSLRWIGEEKFHVTRERIRQIEKKGLIKLRKNPRIKELFEAYRQYSI